MVEVVEMEVGKGDQSDEVDQRDVGDSSDEKEQL